MTSSFLSTCGLVLSLLLCSPSYSSLQPEALPEQRGARPAQNKLSETVLEKVQTQLIRFGVSPQEAEIWQGHLMAADRKKSVVTDDPMFLALGLWQADQETKRQRQAGQTPLAPEIMLTCTLGSELSLSNKPWTQVGGMVRLIQTNPYLTHLDLFRCGVTDQHIHGLMSLFHLTDLSLEENGLTDQGVLNLAAHPQIVILKLWKNKIGAPGAKALAQNTILRDLGLYKNQVGDEGAKALAQSTTLTHLDLRENGIGNAGAQALALNRSLISLRLRYNKITDDGAKAFLDNRHLTHLELARNPISAELVEVLENLAHSHGYLEVIERLGAGLPLKAVGSKKQVRLLSIDGGGIRGLLPAMILDYLEQQVSQHTGSPFHLARHLDLMAGTSTGGLICLGLSLPGERGVPQYLPRTLVDLYETKGQAIFPKPWRLLKKLVESNYNPANLESLLTHYFGQAPLSACVCPTLITAFDLNSSQAHIFDSRRAKEDLAQDFEIRKVARATSAAPTYFPSAEIVNQAGKAYSLVDGGIYANNPTLLALKSAKLMYPDAEEYVVISLGTGAADTTGKYANLKKSGLVGWAPNIAGVLMDNAASYTEKMLQEECRHDPRIQYYRIQPRLDVTETAMDNGADLNIQRLKEVATRTLTQHEKALEALIQMFVQDYGQF